jgi:hypothetical protein
MKSAILSLLAIGSVLAVPGSESMVSDALILFDVS